MEPQRSDGFGRPDISRNIDPVLNRQPIGPRENLPSLTTRLAPRAQELHQKLLDTPAKQAVMEKKGNISQGETRALYDQLSRQALGISNVADSPYLEGFVSALTHFILTPIVIEGKQYSREADILDLEYTQVRVLVEKAGLSEAEAKDRVRALEEQVIEALGKK